MALALLLLAVLIAAMLPLIPQRRRRQAGLNAFPFVTLALLVANVFVFAVTTDGGTGELSVRAALTWGIVPRGANLVTLFTYMFLHGDFWHLLGNMLFLWFFGPHVEEALGRIEYGLFYIGSGIAAGFLHVLIAVTLLPGAAHDPLVGASGAIAGILGLFAVRFWRAKVRVFLLFSVPAIWAIGAFAAWQLLLAVTEIGNGGSGGGVAYWAHIGGLLFGMLLSLPLRMREDSQAEYRLEDAEKAAHGGQLDVAATNYRQIVRDNPADADAHQALARVSVQLRQGEAAHRHFLDALRLRLREGDSPKVAALYEDACAAFETFPLPPALLQRVASACEETERYPLALRALSELCRDHPDSREAEMGLLRLGRLHLHKLDQPQNAAGIFAEFLRLYPSSEWSALTQKLLAEATATAARAYEPLRGAPAS